MGAYDLRTAAYRFCRILGVTPHYVLEDGTVLKTPNDFDKQIQRPLLLAAIRRGGFCQWLSVFYHEDPHEAFEKPYSYEYKLEEWVNLLGEIDQNQQYYKRYVNAKQETAHKYSEVRHGYKIAKAKERIWRCTFYGLCVAWVVLLLMFGVSNRNYLLDHATLSIVLPLGGVSALIVGIRAFFRGYGFVFCCLWGVLGLLSSYIPVWILRYVNEHHYSLFIPAIIVITLIYMLICHLTDHHGDSKADKQLINEVMEDDIKSTLIEPLFYTFKQKSFKFKGSKFNMLDDVTNQVRSISGESVLHYIIWSMMIGVILLEMVVFSPKLLNKNLPTKEKIQQVAPQKVIDKLQKK